MTLTLLKKKTARGAIRFERISPTNWKEAFALNIKTHQQEFVPSVAATLTTARLVPGCPRFDPFAIYLDQKMIGFITCSVYRDDPTCCYLGGFLITAAFQGQGLGKRSLRAFLRYLPQGYPRCSRVRLNAHPANKIAAGLYRRLGFRPAPDRTQRYLNFVYDLPRRDEKTRCSVTNPHSFISAGKTTGLMPKGV